jgi:hypothetical protein
MLFLEESLCPISNSLSLVAEIAWKGIFLASFLELKRRRCNLLQPNSCVTFDWLVPSKSTHQFFEMSRLANKLPFFHDNWWLVLSQ